MLTVCLNLENLLNECEIKNNLHEISTVGKFTALESKLEVIKSGVVVHACNLSTWKTRTSKRIAISSRLS